MSQLEALYRTVGPNLLAYLRRWPQNAQVAEDLLQETFLQAARRPERLLRAASPRAWLFAIARHVALTALRRRRTEPPLPPELAHAADDPDPRLEQVRQAIGTLPDAQREILELRLREELTYEEIASVLAIPIGTVRSRLHNAVRRLREELDTESHRGTGT